MAKKRPDMWYPATGFYFNVKVAGISEKADSRFKEVSGINMEVGSEKLTEGGVNNYTIVLPTQVSSTNLVLKRGMLKKSGGLLEWIEKCITTDYSNPLELKNIDVQLLNSSGQPMVTWTFVDARPVKYLISELDAQKNDVLVETIEFTYTFFKRQ